MTLNKLCTLEHEKFSQFQTACKDRLLKLILWYNVSRILYWMALVLDQQILLNHLKIAWFFFILPRTLRFANVVICRTCTCISWAPNFHGFLRSHSNATITCRKKIIFFSPPCSIAKKLFISLKIECRENNMFSQQAHPKHPTHYRIPFSSLL